MIPINLENQEKMTEILSTLSYFLGSQNVREIKFRRHTPTYKKYARNIKFFKINKKIDWRVLDMFRDFFFFLPEFGFRFWLSQPAQPIYY